MHMCLSRTTAVATLIASVLFSKIAFADGPSAVAAMYRNMASIGIGLDVSQKNAHATPTLVRGIYKLVNKSSGQFMGYINEGGTVLGDHKGWTVWARTPRPMTSNELAEMRSEVIQNIDTDRLIKVEYGDGGDRRMVMFSAVDCSYCRKFEATAAKLAASMNTTFYVVPSALRPTSSGTGPWRTVTNILCAKDKAAAWRSHWSNGGPPSTPGCRFDERQAEEIGNQLYELLASVGIKTKGVPAVLREDGTIFTPQTEFDKRYAASAFGRDALSSLKPGHDRAPAKWLAMNGPQTHASIGDAVSNESAPSTTATSESAGNANSVSVDLGGALKKLFQ